MAAYGATDSPTTIPRQTQLESRGANNNPLTMSFHNLPDTDFEPYCGKLEHYAWWRSATDERFVLVKGTFPDFIQQYVPSSEPYKPLTPKATPTDELRICRDVLDPRDKCLPLVRAHVRVVA